VAEGRKLVDTGDATLSVRLQCELLALSRSSLYYEPVCIDMVSIQLMHLIDEEFTRHPFIGTRRMVIYLQSLGHEVNRKRLQRLYGIMGIEAIYPKKNLSKRNIEHKVYPYLLRGLLINRVNQVWSTDITYIRLTGGFVYLVAIIDWFSRYVIAWSISTSMETDFCIETLNEALATGTCEIFNSDQGSQFTSPKFTDIILAQQIQISMDGKGRALDNIFVERLWRSVKYECVYLMSFATVAEARKYIGEYFIYYNQGRHHQSLGYKTPAQIYGGGQAEAIMIV
jgi:putative transposase